jgi:hypothetical protein
VLVWISYQTNIGRDRIIRGGSGRRRQNGACRQANNHFPPIQREWNFSLLMVERRPRALIPPVVH